MLHVALLGQARRALSRSETTAVVIGLDPTTLSPEEAVDLAGILIRVGCSQRGKLQISGGGIKPDAGGHLHIGLRSIASPTTPDP